MVVTTAMPIALMVMVPLMVMLALLGVLVQAFRPRRCREICPSLPTCLSNLPYP